jgi:hypothetical protein
MYFFFAQPVDLRAYTPYRFLISNILPSHSEAFATVQITRLLLLLLLMLNRNGRPTDIRRIQFHFFYHSQQWTVRFAIAIMKPIR